MLKHAGLAAAGLALFVAHCAQSTTVNCPCGRELSSDGSECVPILSEGGALLDCECPGDEVLLDGGCIGSDDPCAGVDCSDADECTSNVCTDGNCSNPPVADGTSCNNGNGTCQRGACAAVSGPCVGVDCTSTNQCVEDGTCDPTTGHCVDGNDRRCDDGDSCTVDSCNPEKGCVYTPFCTDDNLCTIDYCAPINPPICAYEPERDGADCRVCTGSVCVQPGECQQGVCTPL